MISNPAMTMDEGSGTAAVATTHEEGPNDVPGVCHRTVW